MPSMSPIALNLHRVTGSGQWSGHLPESQRRCNHGLSGLQWRVDGIFQPPLTDNSWLILVSLNRCYQSDEIVSFLIFFNQLLNIGIRIAIFRLNVGGIKYVSEFWNNRPTMHLHSTCLQLYTTAHACFRWTVSSACKTHTLLRYR